MNMKNTIVVSEVMKNVVLNVEITGIVKFKIRTFIGVQLIKLAAWIIGCGIQIELDTND
ncbi:unnamed protein product [marine sediment metagenome]|uniref:Uncharacterized protein n=1 Tax=marine sediment metagenome TaxID=412755 RepID=X0W0Y2_9ZZZZ